MTLRASAWLLLELAVCAVVYVLIQLLRRV
jgi:hypothetical protein